MKIQQSSSNSGKRKELATADLIRKNKQWNHPKQ
jgi:hypothetical protein